MNKTYTKLLKNNSLTITIMNPCGEVYEIITTYGGFISSKRNFENKLEVQLFNHSLNDEEIIKCFMGELNDIGYELKQEK